MSRIHPNQIAGTLAALLFASGAVSADSPVGTTFTYQGVLEQNGTLITGGCCVDVGLWTAADQSGALLESWGQCLNIIDGLLTFGLDFGADAFKGRARWLEIAVCCDPDDCSNPPVNYTVLSPRQELTPTPYALALPGVWIDQTNDPPSVIGGYHGNEIVGTNVLGGVIGGGGGAGLENRVSGSWGTLCGGSGNTAGGDLSTVGGGSLNTAGADEATIAGGFANIATGTRTVVGGGSFNFASGMAATVPGGSNNTAGGSFSFAAGRKAKANHDGAFVWADSTNADFASTGIDQFLVQAIGGVGIGTNDPTEQLTVAGTVESTSGGFKFPDGTLQTTAATGGGGGTLDSAYDSGGPGAGRTITADSGAVEIIGPDGLEVAGTIKIGNSIIIDGAADTITSNGDLELNVNSGRALRLEPHATSPNVIAGHSDNSVTPGAYGACIGGGGESPNLTNRVTDRYGTVSGGRINQAGDDLGTTTDASYATVGGGNNNTASGNKSTVGGGNGNTASGNDSTVGGGSGNTASHTSSTVGGGDSNIASAPKSTVGGGQSNTASGGNSTIGGGFLNIAIGDHATVGGGGGNTASGDNATVGGGGGNAASGGHSTIGGGNGNIASAGVCTISGGLDNTASGAWSTVPGGFLNTAAGSYSFAAGVQAKANHIGAFVWADSVLFDFASTAANQFNVRAGGGTRIFSDSSASVGVQLAAGGNSWSALSDRALKENLTRLDPAEVLENLVRVPVTRWNLKSQDPSIQHIGPMAQDFHAAFGVGESDRYISSSDADGVALAAIQGLYEIVKNQHDRIAILEKKLFELGAKVGE